MVRWCVLPAFCPSQRSRRRSRPQRNSSSQNLASWHKLSRLQLLLLVRVACMQANRNVGRASALNQTSTAFFLILRRTQTGVAMGKTIHWWALSPTHAKPRSHQSPPSKDGTNRQFDFALKSTTAWSMCGHLLCKYIMHLDSVFFSVYKL